MTRLDPQAVSLRLEQSQDVLELATYQALKRRVDQATNHAATIRQRANFSASAARRARSRGTRRPRVREKR